MSPILSNIVEVATYLPPRLLVATNVIHTESKMQLCSLIFALLVENKYSYTVLADLTSNLYTQSAYS